MKKKNTLWYVRQEGEVTGPFPSRVLTNNLMLGRLTMDDQACLDGTNWLAIADITVLHPEQEVDVRTKITLDERNGFDRRQTIEGESEKKRQRSEDRRAPENPDTIRRRQFHTILMQKFREQQSPILWPLVAVALLLLSVVSTAIFSPTLLPVSQVDCNAPADIAVNWNNCLKPNLQLANTTMNNAQLRSARLTNSNLISATLISADMAYADLSFSALNYSQLQNADLVGANLEQADLSNADLSNADLSYANLLNANLEGAILDNVSFDHAIWPNGDMCSIRSVGQCIRIKR
jgi:hypothetical protein